MASSLPPLREKVEPEGLARTTMLDIGRRKRREATPAVRLDGEMEESITNELSFEDAFTQLEQTVQALEKGDLPLARMVTLYEEAVCLAQRCTHLLDEAELRVSRLSQRVSGEVTLEPIEWAAETEGGDDADIFGRGGAVR